MRIVDIGLGDIWNGVDLGLISIWVRHATVVPSAMTALARILWITASVHPILGTVAFGVDSINISAEAGAHESGKGLWYVTRSYPALEIARLNREPSLGIEPSDVFRKPKL